MTKESSREFIARLAAAKSGRAVDHDARIDANRRASEPVLAELFAAGFSVQWIAELRYGGIDYRAATPILAKWLGLVTNVAVKEDIVRCLSIPECKWIRPAFSVEFRRLADAPREFHSLRDALANGLAIVSTKESFGELSELVLDRRMGQSRAFLIVALGKLKEPRAVEVLMQLSKEESLLPFVLEALGTLRALEAESIVRSHLDSDVPAVAAAAKKALAKIEKRKIRQP